MIIITTIDDLRIHLSNSFDLSRAEAQAVAEYLNTCTRPHYGSDWTEYLESLTAEEVHEFVHGCAPVGFAAVGTNGIEAVVWGIGDTEAEAIEDATGSDGASQAEGDYVTVAITAAQREAIVAGDVDVESLGIALPSKSNSSPKNSCEHSPAELLQETTRP